MANPGNASYTTDVVRSTTAHYAKTVYSQLDTAFPFFAAIRKFGANGKFTGTNGQIIETLNVGPSGTFRTSDTTLESSPSQDSILDTAAWDVVYCNISRCIPTQILRNNSGPEAIANLMKEHNDSMNWEWITNFQKMALSAGGAPSGSTHPGLTGLLAVFGDGSTGTYPTATGTYGGINRATNSDWRVHVDSNSGSGATDWSVDDIRTFQRTCSNNDACADPPTLALATAATYAWLESVLTSQNTAYRTSKLSEALGLEMGLPIGPNLTVFPCSVAEFANIGLVSTQTMLFIHPGSWGWWQSSENVDSPRVRVMENPIPTNELTYVQWYWHGALRCKQLNKNGIMTERAVPTV